MEARDPEAFRAFYRDHYRTVCRYLAARADAGVVEDVAAETFLVAWRRREDVPSDAVPWLLNTAGKCLANHRRSRQRGDALVERLSSVAGPGTAQLDVAGPANRRALLTALAAMRDVDRDLLLLHHWDGLAPRQIAGALDLNPVLVRARLHRAGRRLQEELRQTLAAEGLLTPAAGLTKGSLDHA